jgi:DNA-directed RNA polymerase specialized sigma24 family protein
MNIWTEEQYFDVFLMRYFNGFKYKTIALLYGVSIERVRQVNQKAKFILKRKYKIKLKMKENGEY